MDWNEFVTLSNWKMLKEEFSDSAKEEVRILIAEASSEGMDKIRFRAGVIEGIERALRIMARHEPKRKSSTRG